MVDDISGVMDIAGKRIVPMQGCDHRSICRFASESSEGYKAILNVLLEWAEGTQSKLVVVKENLWGRV